MGNTANAGGVEASNLCIMDITKHAVKTIIGVMDANDRLSIVSYSDQGRVVCDLLEMNADGKSRATSAATSLEPGGMTNLWDGLHKGLEVLSNRSPATRRPGSAIFLLTDGEPNIEPPRGHIPMLQRYRDTHEGKYPGVISTFGFGYSMDSPLLRAISHEGDGMYAFIPDSGFVGTAFVNALSNSLVTAAAHAVLSIEPGEGVEILEVLGGQQHTMQSWGVSVPTGTFQFGQSKDVGLRVRNPNGAAPALIATLAYTDLSCDVGRALATAEITTDGPGSSVVSLSTSHVELEKCRLLGISTIEKILSECGSGGVSNAGALDAAKAHIQRALTQMRASQGRLDAFRDYPSTGSFGCDQNRYRKQFAGLIKDFEGQISEATSRMDWYTKWGKHYLPSLKRAHELQQCNNFKDHGIQDYAGVLFSAIRDTADDIFNSLPPPVASRPNSARGGASYRGGAGLGSSTMTRGMGSTAPPPAPVSMAQFNSSSAPCFHGNSQVSMADGSRKSCAEVGKGDVVQLVGGKRGEVLCVLKTVGRPSQFGLVSLPGSGLVVTYWHPVKLAGQWVFPCQVPGATIFKGECDAVYSFLVRSVDGVGGVTSGMVIDGVECITLGHSVADDPVASHPFFGSDQVLRDMRSNDPGGFEDGLVVLQAERCILKDGEDGTGLIKGFVYLRDHDVTSTTMVHCF
jgi:hypothetical protein